MRRYAPLALVLVASFTFSVVGASGAVSANSQQFGGTNGRVNAIVESRQRGLRGRQVHAGAKQRRRYLPRHNLAAFNMSGGVTPWNPNANGEVRALTSNGKRLFAGGAFTTIRGRGAKRIAAISLAGGRLWGGGAGNIVRAISLDKTRLIIGGTFKGVQGKQRHRAAALSAQDRGPAKWSPNVNRAVDAIAVSANRIYLGGEFTAVNGKTERHIVALNRVTGARMAFPDVSFPVLSLELSGRLYVGGSGAGGWLTAFTAAGHKVWQVHTDGGFAAIAVTAHQIIAGGHFNNVCSRVIGCGTKILRHKMFAVGPGGALQPFAPTVNSVLGVFALRVSKGNLWAGGDFTVINGATREHLARFTYN